MKKMKEITPQKYVCGLAACPAVFSDGSEELFVVGRVLRDDELTEELRAKRGEGEQIVAVPKGVITELEL